MIAKSGRPWQPPAIDSLFRRKEDGTIWRVVKVHLRDRQVTLRCVGGEPRRTHQFADELTREFEARS